MSNPAFLIDGFTEKLILERICQNKKINRINLNGNSVSISAMAKRICSLIRLLNNKYYPIIILIDREDRSQSIEEISSELRNEINKEGILDEVRIGVCDRMIENWILADWDNLKGCIEKPDIDKPDQIEGVSGKSLMKKLYSGYQETTDGVNFFMSSNPDIIYQNSNSFKFFIEQIKDIPCFWTQMINTS